jgi:hypothetical protein
VDIARHGVDFDVDGVTHMTFFERGVLNGVGNDIDADLNATLRIGDLVDRKANPVQGD